MTDLISIIGTVASIGSIPLAIYLYLKNAEEKKDKVRREIVRTIAFQIGNGRIPTSFEIQSIINSKCRDSKIKAQSIDTNDVIEDLVAEIISTPILSSDIKNKYVSTLNLFYTRGQVLEMVDQLSATHKEQPSQENVEQNIKELIETKITSVEELKKTGKKEKSYSDVFGLISSILALIIGLVTAFLPSKLSLDNISNFFGNNKDIINISIGIIASLIAGFVTLIIDRFYKKSKK